MNIYPKILLLFIKNILKLRRISINEIMSKRKVLLQAVSLLSACLFAVSSHMSAGPARPGVISVKQSDGSVVLVRVHGDEFHHYVTTEEGYSLTADSSGDWVFAKLDENGRFVPTSVKAKLVRELTGTERRILGTSLRKGLKPKNENVPKSIPSLATRSDTEPNGVPPSLGGTSWKPLGEKNILVLLAEYPDCPFTEGSAEVFNDLLNSRNYTKNGATGSVWQYYFENSNGQFNPSFTVVGPYKLSKNRAWYKDRPQEMVSEVAHLADSDVDFSQFAENGTARDIFVYYSGGAESQGDPNGIWPHRSTMNGLKLDEVTVPGYACSSEIESGAYGNNILAAIGSFCHEFGHIIGLPDLYDTNTQDGSDGDTPKFFSLMAIGSYNNLSRTPPALSILERWMLGWAKPEVLEESGEYSLPAITEGKGYQIMTETPGDYFLLECRGAGKNVWDKKEYLDFYNEGPDWGLLVYHVKNDLNNWIGNTVNNIAGKEHYQVFYSDPNYRNYMFPRRLSLCFFPGEKSVTSISSDKDSKFQSADGKKTMAEIPSIRLDESQGSVKLSVTERNGNISDIKSNCFQHDIILSWKDDLSTSWSVGWKAEGGQSESKSISNLTSSEVHIPSLKDDQNYLITITGNKNTTLTLTLKTEKSGSGFPRIMLSKAKPTSEDSFLMALIDCGDVSDIQWSVDGAETDGYVKLGKGEHYVQAVLTKTNGSKEYFARFIDIVL